MATGKRAGARRATPARGSARSSTRSSSGPDPRILGLSAGITLCVVAWGYLVYAAVDFGAAGRSGSSSGWGMLALASLGAMACLFVGLMLASRLVAVFGLAKEGPEDASTARQPSDTATPTTTSTAATPPPPAPAPAKPARQPGGRRIARR